ncbi:MAG: inositol monophosphatase family protein [Jiangellales bacterium]
MAAEPADSDLAADLDLAHALADEADRITLDRFLAADLVVSTKPDTTPVTDADRAVERAVRRLLAEHRAHDSILGEEEGGALDGRTWVIDPIDGTANYLRGVPVWATLIGLVVGDQVPLGMVSAPALGRRWWASAGQGTWTTFAGSVPRRCHVSAVSRAADAYLSYASLGGWGQRTERLEPLLDECWRTRGFGDFWSYMLLAEGAVDIATEPELALHDMAALVPVVTEAGGTFTDLRGQPGPFGGNALATNSLLHDEALGLIRSGQPGD